MRHPLPRGSVKAGIALFIEQLLAVCKCRDENIRENASSQQNSISHVQREKRQDIKLRCVVEEIYLSMLYISQLLLRLVVESTSI